LHETWTGGLANKKAVEYDEHLVNQGGSKCRKYQDPTHHEEGHHDLLGLLSVFAYGCCGTEEATHDLYGHINQASKGQIRSRTIAQERGLFCRWVLPYLVVGDVRN
jgi:hypothetical protein